MNVSQSGVAEKMEQADPSGQKDKKERFVRPLSPVFLEIDAKIFQDSVIGLLFCNMHARAYLIAEWLELLNKNRSVF